MRSLLGYGFLAPPNVFIILCLVGTALSLRWRRGGLALTLIASVSLYISATPAFSFFLLSLLERNIPRTTDFGSAKAIVLLSADVKSDANTGGLGPQSIERLLFTAEAYRKLHLPVALSGGPVSPGHPSVAALMRAPLENYFHVPVRWVDDLSHTTYENAFYTAQILKADNIDAVVVVAQMRDLPRAIWSFHKVGLDAIPWATPREVFEADEVEDFLPSVVALTDTYYCLHELIGAIYYRIRY